jgi:hypothetical protein
MRVDERVEDHLRRGVEQALQLQVVAHRCPLFFLSR